MRLSAAEPLWTIRLPSERATSILIWNPIRVSFLLYNLWITLAQTVWLFSRCVKDIQWNSFLPLTLSVCGSYTSSPLESTLTWLTAVILCAWATASEHDAGHVCAEESDLCLSFSCGWRTEVLPAVLDREMQGGASLLVISLLFADENPLLRFFRRQSGFLSFSDSESQNFIVHLWACDIKKSGFQHAGAQIQGPGVKTPSQTKTRRVRSSLWVILDSWNSFQQP